MINIVGHHLRFALDELTTISVCWLCRALNCFDPAFGLERWTLSLAFQTAPASQTRRYASPAAMKFYLTNCLA